MKRSCDGTGLPIIKKTKKMQIEYKNEQKMFRCLRRQKLVKATPEEEVRQRLLKILIEEKEIPLDMLYVEERLNNYDDVDTNDRADIIIDYIDYESNTQRSLILIECKRPDIPLTYKVFDQIERYNQRLGVLIIGMTNGLAIDWFLLDEESGEYRQIEELPTYGKIIKKLGFVYVKDTNYQEFNEDYFKDTPRFIRSFVANFYNLLNNTEDLFPLLEEEGFKCIKDGGIRFESNGNAGGGRWNGEYRFILMNTGKSENVTMSFCLYPGELTFLACAFDDNINSHNSLQLKLNDWLRMNKSKAEIWHDGTITVGKYGRAKNEELLSFVNDNYPELIVHGKVFLGELDNSKKLSFKNEDVKIFISNLIKYVLCREHFRIEFKKKKEISK